MARTDCPSVFGMDAMLVWDPVEDTNNTRMARGRNYQQQRRRLDHKTTNTLEAPPDYWERSSLELVYDHQLLPTTTSGNLILMVFIKGKDQRFWQGIFGSRVTNISARILGTPEELDTIMIPNARQQQQQLNFDRRIQNDVRRQNHANQHQVDMDARRNNDNVTMRMVWDFVIPILCFLMFAWLTK
jgi:hypothetical protein